MEKELKIILFKWLKKIVLFLIRLYQKTLSPDSGWWSYKNPNGHCRFYPSCSEYTYQAIEKYGILKGCWKGSKRILRCNPFSRGGYDPVD